MGGSKNKSPAQKEKTQKKDIEDKKTSKPKEKRLNVDTVNINESQAAKYIKNSKVITAYGLAKETNVKISMANTYIQKSIQDGTLKTVGGFSGHHIYPPVSK